MEIILEILFGRLYSRRSLITVTRVDFLFVGDRITIENMKFGTN